MLSNNPVIGIVFGGKSSEHEVSIKSARTIYNALRHSSGIYYVKMRTGEYINTQKLMLVK